MTRTPLLLLLTLLVACGTSAPPPQGPKVVDHVIDTYPPDLGAAAWFFGEIEKNTIIPPAKTEPLYLKALGANIIIGALDEQNRVRAVLPEGEFLRQNWRPLLDVLVDDRCAANVVMSRSGVQVFQVTSLSTTKLYPGIPWMTYNVILEKKVDTGNVNAIWSLSRIFADADVDVQGAVECSGFEGKIRLSLSLHRGWNVVYDGPSREQYSINFLREIITEDPLPGIPTLFNSFYNSF